MNSVPAQLTLGIRLQDDATFENFTPGDNLTLLAHLHAIARDEGEQCLYVWGMPASGRSHLLQAVCRTVVAHKRTAVFLPLRDVQAMSPQILENLEMLSLIAIDDIDAIAGNAAWEEALFHLYNRVRDSGTRLLMSALVPPAQLALILADLQSRLSAAPVFRVHALTEEEKHIALRQRAHARGMMLPDNVGQFLLQHCARDMGTLLQVLDQLDEASLVHQRKLTIPFVKSVLLL